MKHVIDFEFVRSTKNTHLYEEIQTLTRPLLVKTIYIQKVMFPNTPTNIKVTIEDDD